MSEITTFSHLDIVDPNQAMNYLLAKLRTFFRVTAKGKWHKPSEIIKEGEQILKAYDKIKQKYPYIANMFTHQIKMVAEEIEREKAVIGGGANE